MPSHKAQGADLKASRADYGHFNSLSINIGPVLQHYKLGFSYAQYPTHHQRGPHHWAAQQIAHFADSVTTGVTPDFQGLLPVQYPVRLNVQF